MFCQVTLEVGGETYVQVAVVHGKKDVNAVLELGGHCSELTFGFCLAFFALFILRS